MRIPSVGIGLVLLALAHLSFGGEITTVPDGLLVTLSIKEEKATEGEPILLRLTVTNRGTSPVRFVRPRGKNITRICEHGWAIEITGPDGAYGLFPEPRGVEPVVDADIIEVAPGEFVGAEVEISHYVLLKQPKHPLQEVGKTTGAYRASLTYNANKSGPFLLKKEDLTSLFLGPLSSKGVEFEIIKKQEKPNKTNPPDQKN